MASIKFKFSNDADSEKEIVMENINVLNIQMGYYYAKQCKKESIFIFVNITWIKWCGIIVTSIVIVYFLLSYNKRSFRVKLYHFSFHHSVVYRNHQYLSHLLFYAKLIEKILCISPYKLSIAC